MELYWRKFCERLENIMDVKKLIIKLEIFV